jgi:hypothetical protein
MENDKTKSLDLEQSKGLIQEAYDVLKPLMLAVESNKEDKKENENSIRERLADLLELFNKENKPDVSKIKSGLLAKAIETHLTGVNKLEEDLATMESYLKLIKSKEVPKAKIDRYSILKDEGKANVKEVTDNINALYVTLDKEVVNAVVQIIADDIAKKKEIEEEAKGKKKKDPSLMEKVFNIVSAIKKFIKK